jgi:integrase
LGSLHAGELRLYQVENFRNALLDRGMSKITAARYLSTLRAGLGDAGEHLNIGKLIRELERGPNRVECWTKEEAAALITHIECCGVSVVFIHFVRLLFVTGMRRGEALALQRNDIDFDRSRIHIHRALTLDGDLQDGTKWGGERYFPLSKKLANYLRALFNCGLSDKVFPGLDQRSVGRKFKRDCFEAGVPTYKLHCTRHSAISWALAAGMSLRKASEIFGVSQGTLEKHYAHYVEEEVDMEWAQL